MQVGSVLREAVIAALAAGFYVCPDPEPVGAVRVTGRTGKVLRFDPSRPEVEIASQIAKVVSRT